jgi:hypothetical protein
MLATRTKTQSPTIESLEDRRLMSGDVHWVEGTGLADYVTLYQKGANVVVDINHGATRYTFPVVADSIVIVNAYEGNDTVGQRHRLRRRGLRRPARGRRPVLRRLRQRRRGRLLGLS